MLKQTIKFAFKSFRKSALLNYLNLIGLSLGLTIFLLTSLFIYQEATYEEDFSENERIFQIGTSFYNFGKRAITSSNLPLVTAEIPQIEYTTVFNNRENSTIKVDEETYTGQRLINADSVFFKVFDFELLVGDRETILNDENSVVVNEAVALNLFGTLDIIGKTLMIGDKRSCIIKGISKNPKYKTQLDFDFLASMARRKGPPDRFWGTIDSYVYVKTLPNVRVEEINDQLDRLNEKFIFSRYGKDIDITFEEWLVSDAFLGYYAESLHSLRYESESEVSMTPKANINQTNTLLIVGIAALLISIINFINISTAKASNRMKEVAIKRIMGSSRVLLIIQFVFEAFLTILTATVLALGSTELFVKLQPSLFGDFVEFSVLHSDTTIRAIVLLIVGLTLVSGLYPAVYLSSGKIITILRKGSSKQSFSVFNAALLRKCAIVLQFTFSIGLIGAVITMFLQLDFLRTRDIGYKPNNVIIIPSSFSLKDKKTAFKNELERNPSIQNVTYTNLVPNALNKWETPLKVRDEKGDWFHHFLTYANNSVANTMELTLLQGRDLDETNLSKDGEIPVLMNEAAIKALNFEGSPIGEKVDSYRIVGVVKDFIYTDLNGQIDPLVIRRSVKPGFADPIAIKVDANADVLADIEKTWLTFSGRPMKSYMLHENYDRLVKAEKLSFNAVLVFSFFAVLVSCIGLFGLAVFTVDQRIKEFGIRKVLGASIKDIAVLFSSDFAKLIILAFVVAMPLALYFLDVWLNNFSARISLGFEIILLTGCLSIFIAFTTILLQSLKAGRLNPVETLRSE